MDGNRKKIKKKMKTFKESIIDIPRRTYAKAVFDDADTIILKSKIVLRNRLTKQLKEFEKYHPIKNFFNRFNFTKDIEMTQT